MLKSKKSHSYTTNKDWNTSIKNPSTPSEFTSLNMSWINHKSVEILLPQFFPPHFFKKIFKKQGDLVQNKYVWEDCTHNMNCSFIYYYIIKNPITRLGGNVRVIRSVLERKNLVALHTYFWNMSFWLQFYEILRYFPCVPKSKIWGWFFQQKWVHLSV